MSKLRVLDLFSGIGGFSLGLERTGGFETVAFCEIEDFPRRVLAKHWPGVPIYDDVRTLSADTLRRSGITVDVICGGFPCQDISTAGKGAGLAGERSGLWSEYARLIGELRPRFVLVENVAALLGRGLGTVLGDLAEIGYDTQWDCIPASAVGAPHRRDRIWIVAYAPCELFDGGRFSGTQGRSEDSDRRADVADTNIFSWDERRTHHSAERERGRNLDRGIECEDLVPNTGRVASQISTSRGQPAIEVFERHRWWAVEPDVGRVVAGVPSRVDRLKGLGNAVVPQVVEMIGHAILHAAASEGAQHRAVAPKSARTAGETET